jgi:hypothetical protein
VGKPGEGDLELARQDGEVGVAAGGEELVDAAEALGGLAAAALGRLVCQAK